MRSPSIEVEKSMACQQGPGWHIPPLLLNAHWLSEGPQQSCREWPERQPPVVLQRLHVGIDAI